MLVKPWQTLKDFLSRNSIDGLSVSFVVAFSGGADSLALLAAAKTIGLKCAAVYVNHNIRDKSEIDREIALNRKNAESIGVKLEVLEIPPGGVAACSCKGGVEDAARRLRYSLIEEYRAANGHSYVLTGHNRDDCDEADIIRFFRGGRPEGMMEKNGCILRPFLSLPHSALEGYAESLGLEFSVDSTNSDRSNLRSRIRLDLKPAISDVFPNYHSALEERRKLSALVSDADEKRIYEAFRLIGVGNSNNSRVPLETVRGVADFMLNGNSSGKVEYADAVVFRRKGNCIFAKKGFGSDFKPVAIRSAGSYRVGGHLNCVLYDVRRFEGVEKTAFPDNVILLPSGELVIRSFLPDDSVRRGSDGASVSDILRKAGIPAQIRGLVPVIEIGGKVAAVCLGLFGARNVIADGIFDGDVNLSLLVFSRNYAEEKI